ncbi:MAG: NUDIX domain-containing protein [Planctomycetota bacterium]
MTAPRRFRRLHREVLVDNAWHRYCRDRYVQRDGSEGDYFYVDMPGSCAAIPVFEDGTMALVRVHRYLLGVDLWEFPIGGMKDGERPLEVAQKELREEAGLLAEDWTALGAFAPYKGVSTERCHVFLARGLREVPQQLEASEEISVHRMPVAQARRTLLEQECGDGQSMAGLMLLDRWLAAGNQL